MSPTPAEPWHRHGHSYGAAGLERGLRGEWYGVPRGTRAAAEWRFEMGNKEFLTDDSFPYEDMPDRHPY